MKKGDTKRIEWLEKYKHWFVFLFAFILYANTIPNGFNLDDELVTTTNPETLHRLTSKGISAIPEIFTEPYYKDDQGYAYDYRPVVLATFAIEHSLFGDNIHVSHFINALLYALLCLVLLNVLSLLFKQYNPLISFVAAVLFAAHPIHTEVVASVKNRDEILALMFGLLSLLFAIKATTLKSWSSLFFAVLFYFFALLSKQSIISFVVLVPLALILFQGTSLIIPIVFSLAGALLYIPVSGFAQLWASLFFASVFPLSIAALYIIRNQDMVLQSIRKLIQSLFEKRTKNDEANGIGIRPFTIELRTYVVLFLFLSAIAAMLFYWGASGYVFLLCLLYPAAYFVNPKNSVVAITCTLLLSIGLMAVLGSEEYPMISIVVFFVVAAILYPNPLIRAFPFIIIALGSINLQTPFTHIAEIIFPLFLCPVMFLKSNQRLRYYSIFLIILSVSVQGIVFITGGAVKPLNVLGFLMYISVALVYGDYKKYVWLPVGLLLPVYFLFLSPSTLSPAYKVKIENKVITYPAPAIIEKATIDRPINFIENVTDFQSTLEYKLGSAAQVIRKYTYLTLLPYPLSFYYGYKIIERQSAYTLPNLFTLAAFLALLLLAVLLMKPSPVIAFALLIFLIGITVFSNLVLPVPGMMADRFLFVPSLGFSILLAFGLIRLFKIDVLNKTYKPELKTLPVNFKYTLLAILCVYSLLTVARNSQWKNHLTLFAADIPHLQQSAQANNLYGLQLMKYSFAETDQNKKTEMWQAAATHFAKAVEVYPFFNAQYDLARVQGMLGQNKQAEESFYKAALLNPSFSATWLSAGEFAMHDKRISTARSYYIQGLQHIKNNPALYSQLGLTYYTEQKYDSALLVTKQGMAAFPTTSDFPSNIAKIYLSINNKDSTLYYLQKTLVLAPGNQSIQTAIENLKRSK